MAVVGRDPRASGEFLEAAVVAGLAGAGVDVLRLGVIPTPGVAYLTGALDAAFGVVISASHNPARDNGIKFFGRGGVKLPDAVEDEIEAVLTASQPASSAGGLGGVVSPQGGSGGMGPPGRERASRAGHRSGLASYGTGQTSTGSTSAKGMSAAIWCARSSLSTSSR
jgi:hypothetical protein